MTKRGPALRFDSRKVVPVAKTDAYARAVELTNAVCAMAGSMSLISDIENELAQAGVIDAIAAHQTAPIFDWLLTTFSYQGVSDQAARTFMATHGTASWLQIDTSLERGCSCPKLRSYWQYDGCRYSKTHSTCAEPHHLMQCPLPRPRLRNGRLNQTAYSFFLFVRDIARGDLVGWIDEQLETAALSDSADLRALQDSVVAPLRNVFGVSDKVLTMTLSELLIGVGEGRPEWFTVGCGMIAIDTLVHNFLHRTGILKACGKAHGYGAGCYAAGGCAELIRSISSRIDARTFHVNYPRDSPRFVQHAIWRFCAADGLNICNGNQIDDRKPCQNAYCQLARKCGRKQLK